MAHMSDSRITQTRTRFSLTCRVEIMIEAGAPTIWRLLTDADGYARWNSTVDRVVGRIAEGERLALHVPGTSRIFRPTVSGVAPNAHMTWTTGFSLIFKRVRIFEVIPCGAAISKFVMAERFSGLALPSFERFAADLKKEAEHVARQRG